MIKINSIVFVININILKIMGDLADKVIAAYEGLAMAAFINDIITITIILITAVYKCVNQETTWFIWL